LFTYDRSFLHCQSSRNRLQQRSDGALLRRRHSGKHFGNFLQCGGQLGRSMADASFPLQVGVTLVQLGCGTV